MNDIFRCSIVFALLLGFHVGFAQDNPASTIDDAVQMRMADRIRISEAFQIADQLQNEVWAAWDEVPFALLLVADDREFLLRHPVPTEDFLPAGFDSLIGCEVFHRERVFPRSISAAFGAVNDLPTVVFGLPENTDMSSTTWTISLIHEHFHQLQNSTPGYWEAVDALDLAGDDRTGMWMLRYPFPYDSVELGDSFREMCLSLSRALASVGTADFADRVQSYLQARATMCTFLLPAESRYFSFQLWQEGVARYTEYQISYLASEKYEASPAFRSLEDYVPFGERARDLHEKTLSRLKDLGLAEFGRVAFYYVGAGEALLLDEVNPDWRRHYFTEYFAMERLFPSVVN